MVRMRACPKHASERSLYYIGLSKGLSVAGWLRHPGARPSARSQRRAILAPGCARKPGGRTSVLSARRVPRLASRLARQLAFLRKPMTAHGVPLPRRGLGGEHAGRRSRQAAHGRRRAEEGAKGAPAAEGTPSAPSKWMQPEGRAPAAGLASAAGACGQWDAPFPRGVEAPLRAHGFRSAARTGKCDTLRNPRN